MHDDALKLPGDLAQYRDEAQWMNDEHIHYTIFSSLRKQYNE